MGILPGAYISKHEVFKVDVQLLPPAVCLQYKIFKIFCAYTMAQRPNILPPQTSHLLPGVGRGKYAQCPELSDFGRTSDNILQFLPTCHGSPY